MPRKTAILGGAFNPVHYGHLRAAEEAKQCLGLDRVIFVPAGTPPFRDKEQSLASAADRLEMTRLAVSGSPGFEVSDIECRKPGPSYTVETLRELKSVYPSDDFFFILGMDAFLEMHLWREPERLLELASFIVVPRPGHSFLEVIQSAFVDAGKKPSEQLQGFLNRGQVCSAGIGLKNGGTLTLLRMPVMEISSSRIRALISKGLEARYLLPESVLSYIITKGLYR